MKISNLQLTNFRNHSKATFSFEGQNTLIFGANGSGKTNILEAIHLLSTTKSIKAEFDAEMINHDQNFCRLDAVITNDEEKKLELIIKSLLHVFTRSWTYTLHKIWQIFFYFWNY